MVSWGLCLIVRRQRRQFGWLWEGRVLVRRLGTRVLGRVLLSVLERRRERVVRVVLDQDRTVRQLVVIRRSSGGMRCGSGELMIGKDDQGERRGD